MQNQREASNNGKDVATSSPERPSPLSRPGFLAGVGAASSAFLIKNAFAEISADKGDTRAYRLEEKTIVSATRLDAEARKAFPLFNTTSVLRDFDAKEHGAKNDVALYRIVTKTTIPETGETIEVTGLLALPVGVKKEVPVVSWQHGTILSFNQTPSNLTKLSNPEYTLSDERDSLETLLNIQRFAANGFAVIAADYVGKGPLRNGRSEGYTVKGVTTQTCIDVLNAGLAAIDEMKLKAGKLFLHGWSKGALNTQWLHQRLRTDGVAIEATAVASPFNDLGEAWRFWAGRQTFPLPTGVETYPEIPKWVPLCMIVVLGSHERHYKLNGLIEAAVRPQYHAMARKYWNDYDISTGDTKAFPTASDLLVPGFFDGFTDDRNSAFLRQLAANSSSYWNYDSEIRFHYGVADEATHPEMVARALSAGGKLAQGIPVNKANHRNTFLAGLYGDESVLAGHENVLSWFTNRL